MDRFSCVFSLILLFFASFDASNANQSHKDFFDLSKIRALNHEDSIPNDFLVVLNANAKTKEEVVSELKHYIGERFPRVRLERVFSIHDYIAAQLHIPDIDIHAIAKSRFVKFMQANLRVYASYRNVPCKKQETGEKLWGLSRISSRELPDYTNAEYTYLTGDGFDVDAYVIDTGIRTTHDDFGSRAVHGFTAAAIKESGEGDDDLNGHGTHVAGTVGGKTYGVAKNAHLIAVKVLNGAGSGSTAGVVEGIEYVYNDVVSKQKNGNKPKVVVNMSLGGRPFVVGGADEAAIVAATAAGITFVVAAGNDAHDSCFSSPARISNAITVGASDKTDALASFSNHGPCTDVIAPGVGILSAGIESDTDSSTKSGTSMAAPHVAGVVARYLSQIDHVPTPASVKAWVQNVATAGSVNLGDQVNTPNDLLYMACEAETSYAAFSSGHAVHVSDFWVAFSSDDAWIYLSVSLVIIMLLALIGCIMNCCIWRKIKRILSLQSDWPTVYANASQLGKAVHKEPFLKDQYGYPQQPPMYERSGESTKLLA